MRGWDEFSEFLLENRVPTSADFNTYPIRIFFTDIDVYWINEKSISEEPPPKKLVESFLKVSEWNETIMPLEHLKFS